VTKAGQGTQDLQVESINVLAMDTSGKRGSLALGRYRPGKGKVELLSQSWIEAEREQAALLVPKAQALMKDGGLNPGDLGGLLVGAGPGSFTGIRVGVGTAKGMAWALDIPLWALSSLAGAAAAVEADPDRPRTVLFDARGDRLYAAAYRMSRGTVETLLEPRATTVGEVLDVGLIPRGSLLLGDGAGRHRRRFESSGFPVLDPPWGEPSAQGLLRLLSWDSSADPLQDPGRWEPDYLRDTGADKLPRYARAERGGEP
jgi:tRNA threonylcarbamoyladenosine biosynthesis protein TsaB